VRGFERPLRYNHASLTNATVRTERSGIVTVSPEN
jgi:hypothetical protein